MENEIKLLARHEDLATLLHSPLLQRYSTAPALEHLIIDTYFDTPEREFKSQHASLRLRKIDHETVQTLKVGTATDGGLHRREEYASPVRGDRPALSTLRKMTGRKSKLGALLHSAHLKARLAPAFTARVTRTIFPLTLPQGALVECAVDVGDIIGNGNNTAVCEVELELKSGDMAHLFDFALELSAELPLAMGEMSKGDRGYTLLEESDFAASKTVPVKLNKKMTVEQAFSDIVGNCLQQIETNAAGVARRSSEGLHQMRVGLRRLRSALHLVAGMITMPESLQAEMAWLASHLGQARDWDVLAHATMGDLARACPRVPHFAQVTQAAIDECEQARLLAAEAVAAPRYARLVLLLSQWRLRANWRDNATENTLSKLDSPIVGFARKALATAHKRLIKRGDKLNGAAPEARHRIRIAAKKTRYTTEFFQSLFRTGEVRSFVERLSRLQDGLGRLNDAAVADRLLSTLQAKQPGIASSAGYVRGFLAARADSGRRDAKKMWHKFTPARLPH